MPLYVYTRNLPPFIIINLFFEQVQQVSTQTVLNQKAYILFYGLENADAKPQSSQPNTVKTESKNRDNPKTAKAIIENGQSENGDHDEAGILGVKISRKDFAKTAPTLPQTKPIEHNLAAPAPVLTNKERKRLRKEKIEQARLAREQEQEQSKPGTSQDQLGDLSGPNTAIADAVKELEELAKKEPDVDEDKLEEQKRLAAAMSAAAALPTISSSSAVVVNYNDKMEDKRAKLDAVIQLEAAVGKSEDVKKTIFGFGTKKGQFGVDPVTRWDGDDMDIGTPVSEADREAALRNAQGKKKKRVDVYDVDYDRGRVKKVKKKNSEKFEQKSNKFQLQLDIENAVKVSWTESYGVYLHGHLFLNHLKFVP